MPESTGHAKAIEIALSFKLIRNDDLLEARQAAGPASTPEDHLTWLLDSGKISEAGAGFLSKFMSALRAEAKKPPAELVEAAKALLIEPERLDLVWGAQTSKPSTREIIAVEEEATRRRMKEPPLPPPPPKKSKAGPIGAVLAVAALGVGGYFAFQAWDKMRAEAAAKREAEDRLKDAEDQVAPVRKLVEGGGPVVMGSPEAKDALARLAQAERAMPTHVPFLLLEGRLREMLGQEQFTQMAYDKACGLAPPDPAAFAARGAWRWRQLQRNRAYPWGAKELRGMRARREAGDVAELAKGTLDDCGRAGGDPIAQAILAVAKGLMPVIEGRPERDAVLLRAEGLLRTGKPADAVKALDSAGERDAPALALRAAARLMDGDLEGAELDATRAVNVDERAWGAREARALARWARAEFWRWQGCDSSLWLEKVGPFYQGARDDWKVIPMNTEDMSPAFCAARCLAEIAGGDAAHGRDPSDSVKTAVLELGAFPKGDVEAIAIAAEAYIALATRQEEKRENSKAAREKVASCLADAEKIDAKHPEVLIARGMWERFLGRDADAKTAWEAAQAAAPDDPRPKALMAGVR